MTKWLSEFRMEAAIHRHSAELVAACAHRPALVELGFSLHNLASRLRNIGRERKQQVLRHALLDRHPRRGVLTVAAKRRIDLQAGESRKLLHPPTKLAG